MTLLLAAAWAVSILLRRACADLRHRVWLAAILAVALLPALPELPAPALISIPAVWSASAAVPSRAPQSFGLFAIWVVGASLVAGRLAVGTARVAWWTRTAQQLDGVLYSDKTATPMTWGIFRPVVLLPTYAKTWAEEKRQMVILHERAHIERRDWLWQTVAQLVTAVFWFHPLVWLASVELRREAERATDDLVLNSGTPASDYAAQLLEVARHLSENVPMGAVAMVRRSALESRVRGILDSTRRRSPAGTLARVAIVVGAAVSLIACAALQGQKIHKIGEAGLTPPSVASKQEPQYTEEARQSKTQGAVVLRVEVDENGGPQNVRIVKSLDKGLDGKAIEAINQWHFNPGRKNGKPVRVAATIEVNFRLR